MARTLEQQIRDLERRWDYLEQRYYADGYIRRIIPVAFCNHCNEFTINPKTHCINCNKPFKPEPPKDRLTSLKTPEFDVIANFSKAVLQHLERRA